MFDLPVVTVQDRRNYRKFKKFLDKEGFTMLEESVYCRMVPSGGPLAAVRSACRKNRPPRGLVLLLPITEKQFNNIEYLTGGYYSQVVISSDPVVVL